MTPQVQNLTLLKVRHHLLISSLNLLMIILYHPIFFLSDKQTLIVPNANTVLMCLKGYTASLVI